MNVVKQHGYDVNSAQLDEITRWLIENDESRIFPKAKSAPADSVSKPKADADSMTKKMMGQNNLSQPTIYMLPAVLSMDPNHPLRQAGWKKLVEHLASAQHADGSFVGRDAWRPIFNTPSVLTLQVASGLSRAEPQLQLPESESVANAALKYLADNPVDDSQQGLVFQILLATASHQSPAPQQDTNKLVQRLWKLQKSDGGWAQTDERTSDAFATGQALFALHQAGLDRNHPSITSAIAFLVNSQQPDGTWQMTSRPNPEDGMPATNLNPITYAATAWATLGLVNYIGGPNLIE
jgi:hypothetical protein